VPQDRRRTRPDLGDVQSAHIGLDIECGHDNSFSGVCNSHYTRSTQ
jgi:hypothetical protein